LNRRGGETNHLKYHRTRVVVTLLAAAFALGAPGLAKADTVTDWNGALIAGLEAAKPPPPTSARIAAIVQASMFDAVNGIERRYTPYHVYPAAAPGTSRDAAAASAAYTALVALIPSQKPLFDQQLAATLAQISDDPSDPGQSVQRGLDWGESVANDILAWWATNGFSAVLSPYVGGTVLGDWQPTASVPCCGPTSAAQHRATGNLRHRRSGHPSSASSRT
jgi:hypothetical protein